PLSDGQLYRHILNGDQGVFAALRDRLIDTLVRGDIDVVVSDAIEGFNPAHDLCEVLARAAVRQAAMRRRRAITHYTIPLTGAPCSPTAPSTPAAAPSSMSATWQSRC